MKAIDTPISRLRRIAPGQPTQQDVADRLRKKRVEVERITVSDFERGKYLPAAPRFLELYAEVVVQPVRAVREAWAATQKAYRAERPPKARRARRR